MAKPSSPLLAAIVLTGLCSSVLADLVILKTGETLTGTIISEDSSQITIDVKFSAGITERRVLERTEIDSIDKKGRDDLAWETLKNGLPLSNSAPAATYVALLRSAKNFLSEFPASDHAQDVRSVAALLELEKTRVENGDIKILGKWMTQEEAGKERYQINGLVAYNRIRELSSRGDFSGALNAFDQLEKQYPGARSFPDAVELVRTILPGFKSDLEQRLTWLKTAVKERSQAMKLVSETKRVELETESRREEILVNDAIAASAKAGQKWPHMFTRNETSLTLLSARATSELQRLALLDYSKFRQSLQTVDTALEAFAKKDYGTADSAVAASLVLWPQNELAVRLKADVAAAKAAIAKAEAEAKAAAARTASGKPTPAKPTPPKPTPATPTPATPTPATPTPATPTPATPTPATPTPVKTEPVKTEPVKTEPVKVPAAATPRATPQPVVVAAANPADEKPFLLTAAGAITVVVVLLLVAAALAGYRKLSRRSTEFVD